MATASELAKDKVRRLTSVPDDFLSKIPASEAQVYDSVVGLISRLEIKNGSYVISTKNLKIASEISQLLKGVLLSSDYTKYVAEFAREFDTQAKISDEFFKKTFPEFTVSEMAVAVNQISKRETIDLLLNRASDAEFIAPLRDIIEQAVINGSGYTETLKSIRTFIQGDAEIAGKMERYSRLYAHDAFAISDRSYTSVVSEELGIEWFFYSGDTIATTRPFCDERHNQYYYYKEIEAWGAGKPTLGKNGTNQETAWPEGGTWAGRIQETNSTNIYSYGGGWNCRHSILPVSIFSVPKEVIERNIASGNYSPTEKEAELLGL